MDERRLDTLGVIASGILAIPAPVTEVPEEREKVDGSGNLGEFIGTDAVLAALKAGKVVHASNYYGCPYAWEAAPGVYRGTLLQYRAITEDETFATAAECAEWFRETFYATDG